MHITHSSIQCVYRKCFVQLKPGFLERCHIIMFNHVRHLLLTYFVIFIWRFLKHVFLSPQYQRQAWIFVNKEVLAHKYVLQTFIHVLNLKEMTCFSYSISIKCVIFLLDCTYGFCLLSNKLVSSASGKELCCLYCFLCWVLSGIGWRRGQSGLYCLLCWVLSGIG